LASTSNDRYVRLHSTHPPPETAGIRQQEKGEVLAKVYMGAVPTCIVWDTVEGVWDTEITKQGDGSSVDEESGSEEDDEEDVWAGMEDVGEEEEEEGTSRKRKK
jgi:ribosome biogenesis protein NSA1